MRELCRLNFIRSVLQRRQSTANLNANATVNPRTAAKSSQTAKIAARNAPPERQMERAEIGHAARVAKRRVEKRLMSARRCRSGRSVSARVLRGAPISRLEKSRSLPQSPTPDTRSGWSCFRTSDTKFAPFVSLLLRRDAQPPNPHKHQCRYREAARITRHSCYCGLPAFHKQPNRPSNELKAQKRRDKQTRRIGANRAGKIESLHRNERVRDATTRARQMEKILKQADVRNSHEHRRGQQRE